ncbi:lipopolysaccharide biosynthesis protein [Paratractidigestivibacter sp.]|nr:oligosaccharide flippase family protein [Paratractidigestivibacter sp.]
MARSCNRELAVNTGLFALSSFGSKLISFFLLPLYTALLSTEDYGTVDLVSSTVSLLVPLLTLNIQDAVLRFGLGKDAEPEEILSVGLRVVAAGTCVLCAGVALLLTVGLSPFEGFYCAFLVIMFVLSSLSNVLTMYVKSRGHVRSLVVSGIGNTLVMSISAILLLVVVKVGVLGYMASLILGNLFAVGYLIVAGEAWRGVSAKARAGLIRSMVVLSAPLVANSLAWWVNDVSDRYVVTFICGATANGIYAVAYKIPSILSTLQTIFYNAWAISAVKEFDPEDREGFLGQMYELYSGAMAVACSGIIILDVPLAALLYSSDFFAAWQYVPLLLVGSYLNGLALFEGCLFTAARNTKAVSWTTIVGACSSIFTCVVLCLAIGPLGGAVATVVGYVVTWTARTLTMTREVAQLKVSWRTEVATLIVLLVQAIVALQWGLQLAQVPLLLAVVFLRRKQLGGMAGLVKAKVWK